MEFRHLLVGLGRVGSQVVEGARLLLPRRDARGRIEITSVGFDLERNSDIPVPTVSLPLDEMKEVLANIGYRSHDPCGWKESLSWFPDPDQCRVNLDGLDSAGRSRPIGRLAFEVFRPIIEAEVRRKIDCLVPTRKHERIEISIVASLMDGLGSGMLFDVAHLCRTLQPTASLILYVAIPEEPRAHGGGLRAYQNTYAALRELRLFASYPQCFTPTWESASVFKRREQFSVLDQVYCIALPTTQVGREKKVGLLSRSLVHRCRNEVAQQRQQFLAGSIDAVFQCRGSSSESLLEPSLRRATCASVPLLSVAKLRIVERVVSSRWRGTVGDPHGSGGADESREDREDMDGLFGDKPDSEAGPGDAVKEYMRRINLFLRAEDVIPRLQDRIREWEGELGKVAPGEEMSAVLAEIDQSLGRLGNLIFSPNELKTSDYAKLVSEDLQAWSADQELEQRAGKFSEEAESWGTEEELQSSFRQSFYRLKDWLDKRPKQLPGYQRLHDLWEEIDRFDGWLAPTGRAARGKPDAAPLVRHRNRTLRLAILSQASQELNEYQITRNLLRLEAIRRLLGKLRGLATTKVDRDEASDVDAEANEATALENPNLPGASENAQGADRELQQKLVEAVEFWRRPGQEAEPKCFLDQLKERYEKEQRLLFFIPPEGFRIALEDAFHSFVDTSPFVTRIAPAALQNPRSVRVLVVISLPQAFFWYRDDQHLGDFIREVAESVLGHSDIQILRVPALDDIWIYFEEIGRPFHQLAGIINFRAAYASFETSGKESLGTLHIDRALLGHLPSWPESEGPPSESCPTSDEQEATSSTV